MYITQSEHSLMTTIISEQHWTKVFESLVSGPFNYFVKLGEVKRVTIYVGWNCYCVLLGFA